MMERTEPTPAPVSLPDPYQRSVLGRVWERVKARVAKWIEPFRAGFEEHEWTGKLYLLSGVLTISGPVLGLIAIVVTGFILGAKQAFAVATFGGFFLIPVVLIQRRYFLGIARFERWAGRLATVIAIGGLLHGASMMLGASGFGFRGVLLGAAEAALSGQFAWYFISNRDRFRPLDEIVREEPPVVNPRHPMPPDAS